jgi:hypothetical protein
VTVIPQLERDLTEAVARLQRRRVSRLRRPTLVAVGALAAVAAVLVVLGGLDRRQNDEVAAPAGADALAGRYSVFRREASPEDALPQRLRRAGMDPSLTRRVAQQSDVTVYVAHWTDQLCQFVVIATGGGSSGCTPLRAATSTSGTALESTTALSGDRQAFFALVPDDVDSIRLTLRDGSSLDRRPDGNAVLAIVDSEVASVSVSADVNHD